MSTKDIYKKDRVLYIIEAALEYFISLLITDAFLATLLTKNGITDSTAGIITQLASLSFSAQLFAVFFRKDKGKKRFVTFMHLTNQMLFVFLYLVPGVNVSTDIKTVLFVMLFIGGHFISSLVLPYKLTWLMSLVPDKKRGSFTANKEIVSLIGGMSFSFIMGSLVDYYEAIGKEDIGFAFCGITIFVLAILHFLTLIFTKEPFGEDQREHIPFGKAVGMIVKNKSLLKVMLINVGYHLATGICVSFYGTYKINELGLSLKYIAFLAMLSSTSRVLVSRLFGRLADKYSWAKMMSICFAILAGAFFTNVFAMPGNGHVIIAIYSCLYSVSLAGINSGLMNIVFDYVPHSERSAALGISNAAGGIAGFLMAIVGSRILEAVQNNGNRVLSIPVYGQQLLSAIAFVIIVLLIVYMKTVIMKLKK